MHMDLLYSFCRLYAIYMRVFYGDTEKISLILKLLRSKMHFSFRWENIWYKYMIILSVYRKITNSRIHTTFHKGQSSSLHGMSRRAWFPEFVIVQCQPPERYGCSSTSSKILCYAYQEEGEETREERNDNQNTHRHAYSFHGHEQMHQTALKHQNFNYGVTDIGKNFSLLD